MSNNPLQSLICHEPVSPLTALLQGVPEGGCLNVTVTPLSIGIALALLGVGILALQMLVRRLLLGPAAPARAAHEPEIGLREAANRARAERLAREEAS
jgi:hypothetical protein